MTAGECIAGSGSDTINFNITGTADFTNSGQNGYTITPSTALPIIKSTVVINGYSQPGASANTAPHPQPLNGVLLIRLDGTDSIGNGIQIGDGNPSADAGSNSEVRGLIVNGFTTWGMGTAGAPTGVIFAGNYLGVNPEGSAADANYEGIVGDGSDDSVTIGGPDAADRNLASGNTYSGIRVSDGGLDGQIVEGNIAGLAADGVTDLGNGTYGIAFNSANGFVRSNIISGNSVFNLEAGTSGLIVSGNYIGVTTSGLPDGSITQDTGIGFSGDAANNFVGATAQESSNVIAGHRVGVAVIQVSIPAYSVDLLPSKNTIIGNSIFDNTLLGIDLFSTTLDGSFVPIGNDDVGSTANDGGDADTGPNGFINNPEIIGIHQVGNKLTLTYDIDAADSPSDTYRLEFYTSDSADSEGLGQGQTFIGTTDVDLSGGSLTNATVEFTLPSTSNVTEKVFSATATAIDGATDSGFGATSEFGGVRLADLTTSYNDGVTTSPDAEQTSDNASENSSSLADTGSNTNAYLAIGLFLTLTGLALGVPKISQRFRG